MGKLEDVWPRDCSFEKKDIGEWEVYVDEEVTGSAGSYTITSVFESTLEKEGTKVNHVSTSGIIGKHDKEKKKDVTDHFATVIRLVGKCESSEIEWKIYGPSTGGRKRMVIEMEYNEKELEGTKG